MKTINKNWWTQEEKDFLIKNSFNYTLEELSLIFNRETTSIKSKIAKMKLKTKTGKYSTKKWSEKDLEFIKNNKNLTTSEIAKKLNRSTGSIEKIKSKLGLYEKEKYNVLNDIKKQSPELAYMLGFIFADGCLYKFDSKSGGLGKILINIKFSDYIYLEKILLKVCKKWSCIEYTNKKRNKTANFTLSDTDTYNFLYNDLEFKYKNQFFSPKIFKFLSEDLHKYFWRGYLDGDGNVSNRKNRLFIETSFTGPVNMDWSVLTKKLENFNIKYKIYKKDNLNSNNRIKGRWSSLMIYSSYDAIKFLSYIYKDFPKDNIGFTRKFINYVKYLERRAISPYYSRIVKNEVLIGV